MAQSTGSIFYRLKFHFIRTQHEILLIRYQLPDENEWILVESKFQAIENHNTLMKKSAISQEIQSMVRKRVVIAKLSDEEAEPYLKSAFGEACEIDELELPDIPRQGSQSEEDNSLSKTITELLEAQIIQQTELVEVLKSLKDTLSVSGSKSQRVEVTKFDGKNEDPDIWMNTYERMFA